MALWLSKLLILVRNVIAPYKDMSLDIQVNYAVTLVSQSEINALGQHRGHFKDQKAGKTSSNLCYYCYMYGNKALKCNKSNAEENTLSHA